MPQLITAPTTCEQAIDDWLDGRFDPPRSKRKGTTAGDPFELAGPITHHACARARQRGIDVGLLSLAAASGQLHPTSSDCLVAVVGEREAQDAGCPGLADIAVVLTPDGVIITAYRVHPTPADRDLHRERRFTRRPLGCSQGHAA